MEEVKFGIKARDDDYRELAWVSMHDSGTVFVQGADLEVLWGRIEGPFLISLLVCGIVEGQRGFHDLAYSGSFTLCWAEEDHEEPARDGGGE